jgi:PKD repeat protein
VLSSAAGIGALTAGEPEVRDRDFYRTRVFPGRLPQQPHTRDKSLAQLPRGADQDLYNIAILVDDGTLVIDGVTDSDAIAARFYASHADDFDYLNINVASSFRRDVDPEAGFAFESNISNDVSGIGLPLFNIGQAIFPGVSRLKSILNMNDLGEYGRDPNEPLPGFLNAAGGVDILGQEAAHLVGAFVTADNADILGRSDAHWSFFFQSYGSTLEGNDWQNLGGGNWITVEPTKHYSQLDNYLWGFLSASEVTDPMFVLDDPVPDLNGTQWGKASLPVAGVRVNSVTQTPVTMANIIANEGARDPSSATSQKHYTMAWILVIPDSTTVWPEDLEKIDDFRWQWENEFFAVETNGIGRMSSELAPGPVSADFEARVVEGAAGLTVQFDNDSFGSITAFEWDFGDGDTSSERHPIHTYDRAGTYTVTLTVDGSSGPVVVSKADYIRVGSETTHWSDDFETDTGWVEDPSSDAITGNWIRTDPVLVEIAGLFGDDFIVATVQPEDDHTPTGKHCLVTGNSILGQPNGVNDVDGGTTIMVSPVIDLTAATAPVLSWWSWFSNNSGLEPGRDRLDVEVSDDGGVTWHLVRSQRSSHHAWQEDQVRLLDSIALTDAVRIRVRTADLPAGSIVEALVDDMRIFDVDAPVRAEGFQDGINGFALGRGRPNPFAAQTLIRFAIPEPGSRVVLKVYGVDGRLVRTLVNRHVEPGSHAVDWKGRDDAGRRVASGVYVVRLQTVEGDLTRKVFHVH